MAQLFIPTPLRKFTENQASLTLQGETVLEVLQSLTNQYPDLKQYIFNENKIKTFLKLYKGEDDIDTLQKEYTPVEEHDVISIIPAIAGGVQ